MMHRNLKRRRRELLLVIGVEEGVEEGVIEGEVEEAEGWEDLQEEGVSLLTSSERRPVLLYQFKKQGKCGLPPHSNALACTSMYY